MSEQLSFLWHPMARRVDPLSSHIAADDHERSGQATIDRERAVQAVRRWPGSSAEQLAIGWIT